MGDVLQPLGPAGVRSAAARRRRIAAVATAIRSRRYVYADEIELHAGIDDVLRGKGLAPRREVRLGARDRVDFIVDLPGVRLGIEVKIAGAVGAVHRQLGRYAESDLVDALMLVTTIRRHLPGLPVEMGGKTVTAVLLRGGL